MLPDRTLVTLDNNVERICEFLSEVVLRPRRDLVKWAEITKQTPNMNIGYPGQHLASLVTGVEGARTAARGHDLRDHSEVKSCSRVDQLDRCRSCRAAVARSETHCPDCGSGDVRRNNDSKWLLSVKNQRELDVMINDVPRVVFILSDYRHFDANDWNTLQFQVFEIWPGEARHANFSRLMAGYFWNIYVPHVEHSPEKTPAPKNFWPYSFQFYMCNPVRTFHCIVRDALADFRIEVLEYVGATRDRSEINPLPMPLSRLKAAEMAIIKEHLNETEYDHAAVHGLDEHQRLVLDLRDTDRAMPQAGTYRRGSR